MKPGLAFIRAGDRLLPVAGVRYIDCAKLAEHKIVVKHVEGIFILAGADAIDAVMLLKPSAFEGRRMKWARHAWSAHNMVGHPLMQVLAWLGRPKLGVWIHESTTPRPLGRAHPSRPRNDEEGVARAEHAPKTPRRSKA